MSAAAVLRARLAARLPRTPRRAVAYGAAQPAGSPAPDTPPTPRVLTKPLVSTSRAALADLVDLSLAPRSFDASDLLVIPDFVSQDEHDHLFAAAAAKIRRIAGRRYEDGHFDGVIRHYRECSISSWGSGRGSDLCDPAKRHPLDEEDPTTLAIFRRVYSLFPARTPWLPPHVLDLREGDGEIGPHVDNVNASGGIVCAVCLGAGAVAVFRPVGEPEREVRVLLRPRTFYAQVGKLRYDYTHEIPLERTFRGERIAGDRRITVLFRDALGG
ncbi:hypothetical protein DFJ74DRAFT_662238 [Hyaloraphidium curvatum]|nr:hypothetical protein DFJ74DRAFT_662238 [Hyaloraphidium curvatum]